MCIRDRSDEDMPKEAADAIISMLGKLEVSPTDEKVDGEKATVNVTIKGDVYKRQALQKTLIKLL